jgi:F-type H+-transporting ATPase subunit b
MKRWLLILVCGACLAQESEPSKPAESGGMKAWEWANFLVLAAGIGYVVGKNAGPAFDARTRKIRKDMVEADEMRQEAEARAAAVEQRLANLEAEIAGLRAEAQQEEQVETERYHQQTAAEIAKIQAHAEQEIVAAGKAARIELKRYAARLSVELAERKIRGSMNAEVEDALVRGFTNNLQETASRTQSI